MIKKVCILKKHPFKSYCIIFIGVFVTGVLSCNIDNNQSFARYDTIASNHQIKLEESYLRGIIYIDTQDEISLSRISSDSPSADNSNSNSNINTFTDNSEFRQDISGKYNNPKYGITEFEIPAGWFATEGMNGDNGIILAMHPGTTEEFFTKLNSPSNKETLPIMNLIVQDREDLQERQISSISNAEPSSLSTKCTELTQNSTATINDKQFQISTMNCSTKDKEPAPDGIDFGHDELTKSYKYDSPNTIYVLQLILSSEYSPNKMVNEADLANFQPIIDKAIQRLKIG
jgi:hypothetical protein